MTTPSYIADHDAQALARLLHAFTDKPLMRAAISAQTEEIQNLEDMLVDLLNGRWIDTAEGTILDRWGTVLNEPRFGLSDADYRIQLYAKIGQNTSEGTAEDMISIYKILTRAAYIVYTELEPGEVLMTAVAVDPVGDTDRIVEVLRRTKPAGVAIQSAAVVGANAFAFDGDADPNAGGFDDALNPGQAYAGEWAMII